MLCHGYGWRLRVSVRTAKKPSGEVQKMCCSVRRITIQALFSKVRAVKKPSNLHWASQKIGQTLVVIGLG